MPYRNLTMLIVVTVGACAPPPAFEVGRGRSEPSGAANPVFATQLAGPATYLAPLPTAIVVLKPDDLNRNRAFCAAITARLPTVQAAPARSVVAPNIIATRWLVQLPEVPAERATDCDFLVGTYDYGRAGRLIGSARLGAGGFSGSGPFLLLVVPDTSGLQVIGLDGSGYGAGEFGRFVDTWGFALGETETRLGREAASPGLVRSLFDLVAAIFQTTANIAGGIIKGVVTSL